MSHRTTHQTGSLRTTVVVTALMCVLAVITARLVQLQWFARHTLAERASRQRVYFQTIPARPGEILDRRGRLLAATITTRSLFLVPTRITNGWHVASELATALDLDADRLFEKISTNRDKQFLWVKRRLTDTEVNRVKQLDIDANSLGFRDEFLRRYPQGVLAAHVIGIRDIDGHGRGGVEECLDAVLGGEPGQRRLERDARGSVIAIHDEIAKPPRHGSCVVLTLDAVVQLYAERQLDQMMAHWKTRGAAAIVLAPKTGEILAMASRPTFNGNELQNAPANSWQNLALTAQYEPGSTVKPLIVAWALQQAVLRQNEHFDCESGVYKMGHRLLHDHHPYGNLSVTDILVKSSNIGMAKIGERLTNAGLHDMAVAFGLGRLTGLGLPGEVAGTVRPLEQWDTYSTGSVPMGHEIAVTPLQLIVAHGTLANFGTLVSPRIVKYIRPDSASTDTTINAMVTSEKEGQELVFSDDWLNSPVTSRVVSPEIARWIVQEPLTQVVERGTGRKAKLDGYSVFGKTGTAQKIDPRTGKYSNRHHVSSFICGAPSEDPQVLVLVMADDPGVGTTHYGGTVAAPYARNILKKTLTQLRIPANKPPMRAASLPK